MTYTTISDFLKYYGSIRRRTKRIIACIPDEEMEWRPAPGRFSFGDQIRHIATTERYMFAENVIGRPSRYPGCEAGLSASFDLVEDYLDQLHSASLGMFSQLSDQDLLDTCTTPGDTKIAKWKWLRAMIEHEIHHRSQIYVYLGLLNIQVPQLYGLSSEEVLKRSR